MSFGYKLAIFDLDGTVLDTLDDLADSVNAVLAENGYPTHSREAICAFVGNGMKKLIDRALPKGTDAAHAERILTEFKAYYALHCADKTTPYAGIRAMLAALRAAGVKTAVLSNKADFATQALCKRYFTGLFDVVAGEREGGGIPKKPAPGGVFEILRATDISAEDAVYIGDSDVDVRTAANAGVCGIFVSWGFRTAELLRKSGARVIADTPQELQARILSPH